MLCVFPYIRANAGLETVSIKIIKQMKKRQKDRRCLMLPHPKGEAYSIYLAFMERSYGFENLSIDDLDNDAKNWVEKLRGFMNTDSLDDPNGHGLFLIKAEQLSENQKFELSSTVDELGHWFDSHFGSDS